MKRKKKKRTVPLIIISILILGAVLFATYQKVLSPKSKTKTVATENNSPDTTIQQTQTTDDPAPAAEPNVSESELKTKNYQLPTLMYHHIRDFNDPADKIGTNLSVSPSDFAKQLDLIQSRGYTTITFADVESGKVPNKSIILTFDDGYDNFYANAYPELKKHGMKAVSYIIVNDVRKSGYMTRDQIAEIEKNGIEIGSHTLSHPDLATATDARAQKEITESKTYLENLIGKPIISLCYPSGKYKDATEKMVKDAGYSFAVTTNGGITKFDDTFALNRYRINNGTSISGWIK